MKLDDILYVKLNKSPFKTDYELISYNEAIISFSSYTGIISEKTLDEIKNVLLKYGLYSELYLYDVRNGIIEFKVRNN